MSAVEASLTKNGLTAGSYTITAKDANGCTGTASATIVVPPQVLASATPSNPSCFGGTGTITAGGSGGTGAKTFSIDGTTFQASATFSGLTAGSYTITAKDANGCTGTATATIVVPSQVLATATPSNPNCFGGTGTITAGGSGGTGTKTFSIDGTTFQASATFSGLTAGSYTITAKDANGCTGTAIATIVVPSQVVATATPSNPNCFGGTGTITAGGSGGTGTKTFSIDGTTFQASATFSGLTAGGYTITAKDANGCTGTATATINQPSATLAGSASATAASVCSGTGTTISLSGQTATIVKWQSSLNGT